MLRSLFFLSLSLLFFSACNQDFEKTSVKYSFFQCCNFYEDSDCSFQDHISMAECFFEEKNIEVSDLEIQEDGPIAVCVTCCKCPDRESLFLEVANEDLDRILELGFVLN